MLGMRLKREGHKLRETQKVDKARGGEKSLRHRGKGREEKGIPA